MISPLLPQPLYLIYNPEHTACSFMILDHSKGLGERHLAPFQGTLK